MALPKSVGTVGGGNMAEAILRGLLRAGMKPDQLIASDPDASRREHLARELEVRVTESNAEVARSSELVVLAVKPTHVEAAAADLPRDAGPLYVSIVAGLPWTSVMLCASAEAARRLPPRLSVAAIRASTSSAAKRGNANAARMPRIVITTTNSMSVKPF